MSDPQAVSADDLLSCTIAAIVVARPRRLVSCLEYIKLFHGAGDWSGKTGFQVATLEAAAAYIEQGDPAFHSSPAPGILNVNTLHMALRIRHAEGPRVKCTKCMLRARGKFPSRLHEPECN